MRNIGIIISVLLMLVGSVAVGQEIEVERGIDRLRDAAEFKGASEAPRIARRDDGFLRHLGAPPGRSFTTPAALAASPPADRASAFLDENKVALGLGDGQNGLQVKKEKRDGSRTFVHFQQTYSGLKVFGATAVVQVDDQGIGAVISDIMADAGPLRDDAGFLDPLLSREEAEVLALKATMSSLRSGLLVALSEEDSFEEDLAEIQQSLLIGDESDLVVYAPSVLGKEGEPRLVWNVVVGLEGGVPVAERVLVDALFGDIALQYSLVHELTWLTRQIFDDDNKRYSNAVLVRGEYGPPTGIAEADVLYDHVGDTYDFYHDHHARHILWGGIYGMQVKAVSRFCDLWIDLQIGNIFCPMPNALWLPGAPFIGPRKVMFGDGYAVADDVVAHELTHGVTFFESELEYIGESGAINESLSDIWGEFVDQTNGAAQIPPL